MDNENNNSDSEGIPFGDSSDLFDDLPNLKKTSEAPDSKKETSASGSPPGKKIQQKPPVKKAPGKKAALPTPEKSKPPVKAPDKTAAQKISQKKQQEIKPKKESPAKITTAQKETPGKKSGIIRNTLIFTPLVVVLVIVSMYIGALINFDSIFTKKNEEDALKPVHEPVLNKDTPEKAATAQEKITPPPQEEDLAGTSDQSTKTLVTDTVDVMEKTQAKTASLLSENNIDEASKIIREQILSFPYSIYLGSFGGIEKVQKASSDYEKRGLSTYWVKLDLGEKGIWYRLFAGYFQKREEANEYIKTMNLQGAESKLTKYANLIGTFTSSQDMDKHKDRLEEMGYSPYIINDAEDTYQLYTGAFYQKGRAEEQNSALALEDIESELVER